MEKGYSRNENNQQNGKIPRKKGFLIIFRARRTRSSPADRVKIRSFMSVELWLSGMMVRGTAKAIIHMITNGSFSEILLVNIRGSRLPVEDFLHGEMERLNPFDLGTCRIWMLPERC